MSGTYQRSRSSRQIDSGKSSFRSANRTIRERIRKKYYYLLN